MAVDMERLKIFNFQVDELRPVKSPEKKAEWEKRMKAQAGVDGFKITDGMELFDTCCGGNADDCGAVI